MKLKVQKSISARIFEVFSFIILLILPFILVWIIISSYQDKIDSEKRKQSIEEMSELTAHMFRLADPQTFLQNELYNLNKSTFKWNPEPIDKIPAPNLDLPIKYFLFNDKDERIAWPNGNSSMQKMSKEYLQLIKKIKENPNINLNKQELNSAKTFSGNSSTPQALANSPDTLINLQSFGTNKYGAYFQTDLYNGIIGSMIVFINTKDINTLKLASNAVNFMYKQFENTIYKDNYKFCWINLNDRESLTDTKNKDFSHNEYNILINSNSITDFEYEKNLYSIIDTSDGIRLVCKSPVPNSIGITTTYLSLLICVIPTIILLYLWKTIFNVSFSISTGVSFLLLIVYMATLGTVLIIGGLTLYRKELQKSIIEDYKQKAEDILSKVDKNYETSYANLKKEYRNFIKQLSKPEADIEKILSPLERAQKESEIVFAGYLNTKNEYKFVIPNVKEGNQNFASKYYALIQPINEQMLDIYNSSRSDEIYGNKARKDVLKVVTGRPIGALLFHRSKFQNIVFGDKETLCFVDLITDENDIAKAGLYIIHDMTQLQLRYLSQIRQSIAAETGFDLVAFPKKTINQAAYFPSSNLKNNETLWKLNDLIDRSQIINFKTGIFNEKRSLLAGIPCYNLKDYNLFLIMPLDSIIDTNNKLKMSYLLAIIITILFIILITISLTSSVFAPINQLNKNLKSIQNNKKIPLEAYTEDNKLVSISAGLADFVLKSKDFTDENLNIKHLIPEVPLNSDGFAIFGFRISFSNPLKEFFTYSQTNESNSYAFMMNTNNKGSMAIYMQTICKTALKILFDDLNIHSASECMKNLNEFFQISLKKPLNCDSIMFHIPQNEDKVYYSGSGKYSIYKLSPNQPTEIIKLPNTVTDNKMFYNSGNQIIEHKTETTIFIVSEYLQNNLDMQSIIESHINKENFCKSIQETCIQELKKAKLDNDAGCVLIIKFAEKSNNA